MGKSFFLRLAFQNVRRNKNVYFPYMVAVAIISGVFFLTVAIIFSPSLSNMPSGVMAKAVLTFAVVVFGIFAFSFMLYINGFLISRRKREFGLYSVLGLEKRHVCRVLLIENALALGTGVGAGFLFAALFGRLIFMLLLHFIHSAPDSVFLLPANAFIITGILFGAIFGISSLYNTVQVRLANPIELLSSEKKGEKESRFLLPVALFGAGGILFSYYISLTVSNGGNAVMLFFPLAMLVIAATYALFRSGSIVFLKFLRGRKKLYYKPDNFVSISGLFQRMRQNASGLATICILGTMLVVTVCLSTSLYFNQEASLRTRNPFDVTYFMSGATEAELEAFDTQIGEAAAVHNLALSYDQAMLVPVADATDNTMDRVIQKPDSKLLLLKNSLVLDGVLMFDMQGSDTDEKAFLSDMNVYFTNAIPEGHRQGSLDIIESRESGYGIFGGLVFAGAFFAVLFLTLTILIIYFKQITEGHEDRERFVILQKVGMDDGQVRTAINRQILWVFFVPLAGALVNAAFSTRLIVKILEAFGLFESDLTILIMIITCAVFSLVYLMAYRLTAKTYYKIVKW